MIIVQIDKKIEDLHAVEHDVKTRFPVFQFKYGLVPYDLTDCTVRVYGTNSLVNSFFNDLEIINAKQGIAKLELTDTMLVKGITKMQLVIMPSGGGQLKTRIFNLINGESLVNADAIEGSNEYKAFEKALSKIGNIDSKLENANTNSQAALNKINLIEPTVSELKKLQEFNIEKINPEFYTELSLGKGTVLQLLQVDNVTGEMYATQVSETGSGYESYYISRLDKNGKFIDGLEVQKGGHGTAFAIEREGSEIYIWSNFDVAPNGSLIGNKMTRFKYKSGTISLESEDVKVFEVWSDAYRRPAIDTINNKIAFYINRNGKDIVELRNLTDVKNGIDNLLFEIEIPSDLTYAQGMDIDDKILYWRTGDTNATSYADKITTFNFETGARKEEIINTFGAGIYGKFEGDFREPEGVCLIYDNITKKKILYAPIVTGYEGQRIYKVYCFYQLGISNNNTSVKLSQVQPYPLTNNEGKCLFLPKVDSILKINKPGTYYMSTSEAKNFSDHPGVEDGGWLLEVTPQSVSGMFKQILTKNSVTYKEYRRICRTNGEKSDWKLFQ